MKTKAEETMSWSSYICHAMKCRAWGTWLRMRASDYDVDLVIDDNPKGLVFEDIFFTVTGTRAMVVAFVEAVDESSRV